MAMMAPGNMAAISTWSPGQLESLWNRLQVQISPFTHVIALDGELYRMLDKPAKNFIVRRFGTHVNEDLVFCRDGNGPDRYYLGAPRHFVTGGNMLLDTDASEPVWIKIFTHTVAPDGTIINSATSAAPTPIPKPDPSRKIPRPPNAYILYRKERHLLVKQTYPEITNNEISQVLGKAWNMETREIRSKYKDMAERIKKDLLERYPEYVYKPRRPNERRRRRRILAGLEDDPAADAVAVGNN